MGLKVGFIGLGIMGESMCENIIKNGYETWIFDIDRVKTEGIERKGGKPVNAIGDLASIVDVIFIMVPNNDNVRDVIDHLLPSLKPGTTIVDMSTISPAVSKELAIRVKDTGSTMLDAPVVKSKAAAISGTLGIYVGGDNAAYERVLPLLRCMGRDIIHLGSNGTGLVMKLCHNALVAEIQNGVNEMICVAKAAGIADVDTFAKCMSYGGAQNFYLDAKAKTIADGDFSPKFPLEHMYKDLSLMRAFSNGLGLELPGVQHAFRVYSEGMERGLNKDDFSASIKIVDKFVKK